MKKEKLILIWLLAVAFLVNFSVIYGRKIPVGGNGGDTIIHMAMIRGIYLSRNPFLDQHYNVYPNWYTFFYHSMIALLSKITGISIWNLMIWTPMIFSLLMVYAWYKLGKALYRESGGLLFGSLSFLLLESQLFPNPKELLPIFLPLFYLSILKYFNERRSMSLVLSGAVLGLMLWSHYGAALPVVVATGLYSLLDFKNDRRIILVPIIGALAILPFLLNVALHIEPGATLMVEGKWKGALTLYSALHRVIPPLWGLLMLILALLLISRGKDRFWNFILVTTGVIVLINILPSVMHYLGGPDVFPSRFAIPLRYTYLLLYGYVIETIMMSYKPRWKEIAVLVISVLFVIYGSLSFLEYNRTNFSSRYSCKDFKELAGNYTEGLIKVSMWINENTGRDDYLIGHPYTLEWIAGFTGRPVVAVTYGHGNPFLNMKKRRRDIEAFFIEPSKRKEIIERYGIQYIVIDPLVKKEYNVTIDDFQDCRIAYRWGDFYILKAGDCKRITNSF